MNQRNADEATRHLSVDELLSYVMLTKQDPQALAHCAAVNRHIRGCSACLRKVRAFLQVRDGFRMQGAGTAFPECMAEPDRENMLLEEENQDR